MKYYHEDLAMDVPDGVYYPREDTRLLARILEQQELAGKKILEIGCGSGMLSIIAAKKGAIVVAVDADINAIKAASANAAANKAKIRLIQSDLFQNISGTFDMIFFNPPYLPDESHEMAYSGGPSGRKVVEKFIAAAKPFLKPGGKILLLISSLTVELFGKNGFSAEVESRKKIPWEELIVVEAK
ncbi:MAG: methyltransferase [Candidatus Aenigmarchaeota archaeon]|nr:methyltransferase [Candidatus Aenigmarchaeota archaeon]